MGSPERWLTRGIESGRFRARKVGRHWRMTRADIDALLDVIANTAAEPAATSAPQPVDNMVNPAMFVSRRRRLAVAQ